MLDEQKNRGVFKPYLRNVNVRWGEFDLNDLRKMKFEDSEYDRYTVKSGDLIVCEGGEPGRCAVWRDIGAEMKIQKALHRVRPAEGVKADFLCYVIRTYAMNQLLDNLFTGSTIKHLTGQALERLLMPIPPKDEQQHIVSKLEQLLRNADSINMDGIDFDNYVILAKQKILDLAIRGKLVPQNPDDEPAFELLKKIKTEKEALKKSGTIKRDKRESFIFRGDDNRYYEDDGKSCLDITGQILFDLPKNWCWTRLHSLGEIIGGGTPSTTNRSYWDGGSIAWLSPADLTGYSEKYIAHGKRNITKLGLKNSSATIIPAGSILYSSRAPIGYVVISTSEMTTNQGFKSLVPFIVALNEFYYYALKALTDDIKSRATGTTFREISGYELGATCVPLPPLTEQKRIVSQIELVFAQLETMQE